MFERFVAERGIELSIALHKSHSMSISAIIERSDLIAILPSSVAHIYEKNASPKTFLFSSQDVSEKIFPACASRLS
ncbi:UNVERIFIED_ORG: hypothetical protein J3D59_003158 [Pseudomonas fluorescens]|jgi:hypothetical protein